MSGAEGASRIVLVMFSAFDGMTGFNSLPPSPVNIQVAHMHGDMGFFFKLRARLSALPY